jgi:lambda repressor-like predicted transcriptional regulator
MENMDPKEIKIRLIRNGVTQAEIARQLKVAPCTVCEVINGRTVSHRIRVAIADAIKTDIRLIWPSPYLVEGGPRKKGRPNPANKPCESFLGTS